MMKRWQGRLLLLVLPLAVGCRQAAKGPPQAVAQRTSTSEIPKAWSGLNLPRAGLLSVSPESDDHGFYADYSGHDRLALIAEVSSGLTRAGYTRSCTAVDGFVRGFSKDGRELALKVDVVGVLSLSLFDAKGNEPLLHGLCFARYREGPWHTLDAEEKKALVRHLEAGETEPSASPPPRK